MVRGFLSTFGFPRMLPAPAVQGLIYLHRLNISTGWVHFLVDTGSSNTCLHGTVVLSLQNRMLQSTLISSRGVGGQGTYYTENATVILVEEDGSPLPFPVDLLIQKITPADLTRAPNPSLLGREILWNFDVRIALNTGSIELNRLS